MENAMNPRTYTLEDRIKSKPGEKRCIRNKKLHATKKETTLHNIKAV